MKKIVSSMFAIEFLLFSWATLVFSQTDQTQLHKTHEWGAGIEISHITYEEPDIMEQKGIMYGLVGSYTYRPKTTIASEKGEGWIIKAEGRSCYGQVDYTGSGTMDDIDDYLIELRGLGGYDFPVTQMFTVIPYVGLGYRYLNDDSSGRVSSTGASGYMRESNYFYSPIGVEAVNNFRNGWSIGLVAEYDLFLWGQQKSYLSDVYLGLNDVENDQLDRYGLIGSIKLMKKNENLNFILEPFITYWDIETSEIAAVTYYGTIIGYAWEPSNNSTEFGCKLIVEF